MIYKFDFDCLRGANDNSQIIIQDDEGEIPISSIMTDSEGNIIINIRRQWKMTFIDESTEREIMIRDIPLSDELKEKNPRLYEEILRLRGDDGE